MDRVVKKPAVAQSLEGVRKSLAIGHDVSEESRLASFEVHSGVETETAIRYTLRDELPEGDLRGDGHTRVGIGKVKPRQARRFHERVPTHSLRDGEVEHPRRDSGQHGLCGPATTGRRVTPDSHCCSVNRRTILEISGGTP